MTSPPLNRLSQPTSNRSLKPPALTYQPPQSEEESNLALVDRSKNSAQNHLYNLTSEDGTQTPCNLPSQKENVVGERKAKAHTLKITALASEIGEFLHGTPW